MGWSTDLKTGGAAHLDAVGAGTWRPDGTAYLPGEIAIVFGRLTPEPDRQIALATYQLPRTAASAPGDVLYGLQARIRGTTDPRTADDIADAVTDAFDFLPFPVWGSVAISQIYLQSGDEEEPDENGRHERVLNFYVQAKRASAHLTE